MPTTSMPDNTEQHLEPRVARLETGLETLTRNVSEMAVSMRENSTATNNKIDTLVVAVTQAQAPRRTDWGVIISAIGLILALGAAVLIPLNQTANENKEDIGKAFAVVTDHMKLDMHPVGQALVHRLEEQVVAHDATYKSQLDTLEKSFRSELDAVNKRSEFFSEKLLLRVEKIEGRNMTIDDKDNNELRQWRLKALGLCNPITAPVTK